MQRSEKCIVALGLMAQLLVLLKLLKNLSERNKRRFWIKPYLHPSLRDRYGAFSTLFTYFSLNSQGDFYEFLHLDLDAFIE